MDIAYKRNALAHDITSAAEMRTREIVSELQDLLGAGLRIKPVGSRITCSPPPVGTDEDWLILVEGTRNATEQNLIKAGFTQDGSPGFYTGNDAGGFRSWRRGDINLITTQDPTFFDLFLTATHLAKRFNLLDKGDRIALFQAVLYGVQTENLSGHGDL